MDYLAVGVQSIRGAVISTHKTLASSRASFTASTVSSGLMSPTEISFSTFLNNNTTHRKLQVGLSLYQKRFRKYRLSKYYLSLFALMSVTRNAVPKCPLPSFLPTTYLPLRVLLLGVEALDCPLATG